MNFWFTVHWPRRVGDEYTPAVWLRNGHKAAGRELKEGDHVLIYETKGGRTELRDAGDGTIKRVPTVQGAGKIIAIGRVKGGWLEEPRYKGYKHYADGSEIWWRWYWPLGELSTRGNVPRKKVNEILEHSPNNVFHGYGDKYRASGLKKLCPDQYYALAEVFRRNKKIILPRYAPVKKGRTGHHGIGIESERHRRLKDYVSWNPSVALGERALVTFRKEYPFPTGDRADIVLKDHTGKVVGVEVEDSADGNQGVLQAIKYRYMLELVTKQPRGQSLAFLVAYSISPKIKRLCARYDVKYFVVNARDVEAWAQRQGKQSR